MYMVILSQHSRKCLGIQPSNVKIGSSCYQRKTSSRGYVRTNMYMVILPTNARKCLGIQPSNVKSVSSCYQRKTSSRGHVRTYMYMVILPTNARTCLGIQPSNVKKCLVMLSTKDKLTWACKNIHEHGHTTNERQAHLIV